jgi:hypothetical protein
MNSRAPSNTVFPMHAQTRRARRCAYVDKRLFFIAVERQRESMSGSRPSQNRLVARVPLQRRVSERQSLIPFPTKAFPIRG